MCETWLKINDKGNKTTIRKMLPSTHTFHHKPRPRENTHGGGVGIFLSKAFTEVKFSNTEIYKSFEHLNIDFNHNREKMKFIVVYRPPKIVGVTHHKFREDLQHLLSTLVDNTRKLYICGDFNFWVDDPCDNNACQFLEIMDSSNYTNHVNAPTTRSGHTLDLVLSNKDMCSVRNVQVEPDSIYVHRLVIFELDLMTHKKIKKKITFRKKSGLKPELLIARALEALASKKADECTCKLNGTPKAACCNCLTDCYNSTLKSLYEEMCPMVEKEIIVTDREPWFNSTIKEARIKRRRLEKEWRKKRTNESRLNYTRCKN